MGKPRYERKQLRELWLLEAQIDSAGQHLHKALGIVRQMIGASSRGTHDTTSHLQKTLEKAKLLKKKELTE